MDLPSFLDFTPVPSQRARADGWTADVQRRFILALARCGGVKEATGAGGGSRQTAHALRGRAGSESFPAACDRAVDFARTAPPAARTAGLFGSGIETIMVPRYDRGRLIGFVQRQDHRGVIRTLNRRDRIADQAGLA